jgi:glycosyltransferase involved in cell wall biosynthesis
VRDGHRAAYVAFDRFPSSKGSAVHIRHMAAELFDRYGGGLLCVLGGGDLPAYQREKDIEIVRFDTPVPNLIDRAEAFSGWVADHLAPHWGTLELCHVRDPWSALPVMAGDARQCRLVYEVNGLPSIELPYAWPHVAPATLDKIRAIERACLERADAVVVPSAVIARSVIALDAAPDGVHVVPNGADLPATPPPRPADAPARYLIYVGALQPWQGVDVLLRAFARLADLVDLTLVICSSVPEARSRPLRRLARSLGVADRVLWRYAVPHADVAGWLAHAALSVAPLTGSPRNLDQGCSPLKIWESMAAGVPVVASDLPAVRELVTDPEHGRLVPPDRPAELARAIRVLLEYPDAARAMAHRGQRRIAENFTWAHARSRLAAVYEIAAARAPR